MLHDALLLSRIQFAMTVGFHFLFPPITIGLAWLLVCMEWRGWKHQDEAWVRLSQFFASILALTFAVGVASGIVMEFQFGMNWSRYSEYVGDIFGAPLAAEGVFAFFLESTFLGLYLFGRGRVSKGVHWFACLMVAVGATISAFWIIVANSWQQTPAGYHVVNGRAELTSFVQAVFNPSTMIRFLHQLAAALTTGAFLVAGVSAYRVLRQPQDPVPRRSLRLGLVSALIFAVAAAWPTGDRHAQNVAAFQPAKLAAMEGLAQSQERAPLLMFGIPHADGVSCAVPVPIPGFLSLLAYGDANARVKGLNEFAAADRPPVVITFAAFHLMVALGVLFILLALAGLVQYGRGKLCDQRGLLWLLVAAIPLPLLANQFGWITAEVGRQPWIVYGLLRTAEASSPTVKAGEVLASIALFGTIYALLGALYVWLMARKVKAGPAPAGAAAGKAVA